MLTWQNFQDHLLKNMCELLLLSDVTSTLSIIFLFQNKSINFRKVLEKRRSKKWQKFKTATKSRIQSNITLTEKVTKNNDSIKISSNQSGNYSNNGRNILKSREGSGIINFNESLISGSSSNVTVREEENHLNGINRFITVNRKTREKYKQRLNRTKETATTVKINNVLTEDKHRVMKTENLMRRR